jgi:hypothetical protein
MHHTDIALVWAMLQGPRWSIPYFVNPSLNFVIQGPEKRWGPVTGFDLLSKTGEVSRAVSIGAVRITGGSS